MTTMAYLEDGPCEVLSLIRVCHLLRLLTFHISNFFSQTIGPIRTKLGINVTLVVLNILYDFCFIWKFNVANNGCRGSDLMVLIATSIYEIGVYDDNSCAMAWCT